MDDRTENKGKKMIHEKQLITTPYGGRLLAINPAGGFLREKVSESGETIKVPTYRVSIGFPKLNMPWQETEWGKILASFTRTHLGSICDSPSYNWGVQDGDANYFYGGNQGKTFNCDKDGHPNHWVFIFSSGYEPKYTDEKGNILPSDEPLKAGDYVQVVGTLVYSTSKGRSFVSRNHNRVSLSYRGEALKTSYGDGGSEVLKVQVGPTGSEYEKKIAVVNPQALSGKANHEFDDEITF